jgi:hypothetical protein
MRLTWSRLAAVVTFVWLLTSLAATAAVSPAPPEPGGPEKGTPARATPVPGQAIPSEVVDGEWIARSAQACTAAWVVPTDPFAIFTGAYTEAMGTVAAAILPALSCRLQGGA